LIIALKLDKKFIKKQPERQKQKHDCNIFDGLVEGDCMLLGGASVFLHHQRGTPGVYLDLGSLQL
jgi:hypothetical protein